MAKAHATLQLITKAMLGVLKHIYEHLSGASQAEHAAERLLVLDQEDHGRGTMTQPASMGPAPANPSSAFVSASSGPAASQPSMPAVSLPPAAAPAFGTEHDEVSP